MDPIESKCWQIISDTIEKFPKRGAFFAKRNFLKTFKNNFDQGAIITLIKKNYKIDDVNAYNIYVELLKGLSDLALYFWLNNSNNLYKINEINSFVHKILVEKKIKGGNTQAVYHYD